MTDVLSNDTKKIIDDARDTLVGQIPVPMMQCQQITLALVYKFMSDDDEQAIDMGGQPHYFIDDLDKYTWDKIVSRRLDDTQRSELYREGLTALRNSQTMPTVFREIFKDAVVPYGDHRTLALFLDTMNRMEYDDSEKLGDAYEYLLKTAEAQADAGQFRTPRHIIDFIVNIVNPQKHEIIIDPACGTAGFLVSAYQHVKSQHELSGGETTLSTLDWTRLADNLKGYDISPEMTKLAMANMYLHTQNKNPNIDNYDTLTSTDHWNEYADVMLANPPFMTPKGGIKPHARFRIPAKRAEVLFVDYIASHLNEHGRAGIIVPEGIIFKSQNAYKQLRRILLDESLVAVISLPGGVFNPYSGVKTSILILDKVLGPNSDSVAFFKVEKDGYDLGAQRRPIGEDDLPAVTDEIGGYLDRLRLGESLEDFHPRTGLVVEKVRVAEDGDYVFNGERYRTVVPVAAKWPLVPLKDCCRTILSGGTPSTAEEDYWTGDIPWITSADIVDIKTAVPRKFITKEAIEESTTNLIKQGNIIVVTRVGLGKIFKNQFDVCISQDSQGLIIKENIDVSYLVWVLQDQVQKFKNSSQGSTIQGVTKKQLSELQIPLPPLEIQREVAAEIESCQRVIDGVRQMVRGYIANRPAHVRYQIYLNHTDDLPVANLGDVAEIIAGQSPPGNSYNATGSGMPFYQGKAEFGESFIGEPAKWTTEPKRIAEYGDILMSVRAPVGPVNLTTQRVCIGRGLAAIRPFPDCLFAHYAFYVLRSLESHITGTTGAVFASIDKASIAKIKIPLPPLETQQAIVAELDEEQAAVDHARRLAARMEQRIQNTIARVWEG